MAKNLKRLCALVMALVMCGSTLSIGVSAAETPENPTPAVTVQLVPGKDETSSSAKVDLENVTVTRDVKATTSDIIVTTKQTPGELTAVQSALKFDRNSTADQKAQKVARELYTDNGHFHDPSTFTVTDAPEGYPFKYVGHGDYSGHYVSHIKVIYERDAAGNAIKDANGNYVIKELRHADGGAILHYGSEPTINIDGPYHYATGTRTQQFLLMDEAKNTYYAYCVDLATGAEGNTWYALANLEDNNYYASEEAENHVRGIVFNGYWGTESGTGSLASLKAALKAAVAAGSVEDNYNIKQVNRKKFTTGYELAEGEYHYGSYVYWDIPPVDVTLTADIIDQMTEGEALDAMQAAIWSWANGSQATLNGVDGVIIGDMSAASSAMSDSLNGKNDPEGAARTRALYAWLMSQKVSADDAKTVIVNDKTFVEDMSLTIGKQLTADAFEAKLSFSNSFTVDQNKDNLKIVLTYVDADGETKTIEKPLTGEGALVAENGYYTIDGLKLSKANPFQFTLNIVGEQYLTKNAYIFTSQKGVNGSQTFVSLAEGTISVDVSKTVDVTFDVENTFTPVIPPKPPVDDYVPDIPVDKKADGLDEKDQTNVTLTVGGESETAPVDVVIALGAGIAAEANTRESMISLIKPLVEKGVPVKLGLVAVEHYKDVAMGLTELTAENYVETIDAGLATIKGLPAGPTNLHSNIEAAKAMLDADGAVMAENKYFYVIATGRTYNYDNENGAPTTIINKLSHNGKTYYYWGHYLWQSQRGQHTSLYRVPTSYNNNFAAYWADVEKWVAADGDTYAYTFPIADYNDPQWFNNYMAENGSDAKALGLASSRFGWIIHDLTGKDVAAIGSGTNPQNALNYERAQYEAYYAYKAMVEAGYKCQALCSESVSYQNYSPYMSVQGVTPGIQLGHSFMDHMAKLSGQEAATVLFQMTDNNGNYKVAENFFSAIEAVAGAATVPAGSYVEDFIGSNANGNFEFKPEAKYLTLVNNGVTYKAAEVDAKEGADASFTFTAPEATEPTFTLDYYYGDGKTTEKFVWTFGEDVTGAITLTYKLQLIGKQEAEGNYIVNTNNSATLYPAGGDPKDFPIPEVNYTVEEQPEIPTVSFKNGDASNISFMLLDPATGEVEFVKKYDIGNETSYEIPTEEGKISCVFIKQSTSGMFWASEELNEAEQNAVIDCLKANNPSYKGYNAFCFGEGNHELEFKKGKFVTYTFAAAAVDIEDEDVPGAATPEATETPATEVPATEAPATEVPATEAPATEPEHDFHGTGKTHLLGDAEGDLETFNFKFVEENIPKAGEERYAVVGAGEQTEFWTAYLIKGGDLKVTDKNGTETGYAYVDNAKKINGIYLDGVFYPADSDAITYPGKEEGKALVANYNGLQQAMLMNGNGKKVAVYCADHVISTTTDALYDVVNIEDATHFNDATAGKIRAVAVNGYWGGTETVDQYGALAKMKAMMKASGEFTQEEIDHLSPGVALSATQFAIWELANNDDNRQVVNVQYIQKNRVAGYNGKTWNTLKVTPEEEIACVDLIFKLSHYLTQLNPISVSQMSTANTVLNYQNILKDVNIEVLKKAEGHENNADSNKDNDAYVTNVTFDMLKVSEKDSLVAKIVDADGNVYAIGRIAGEGDETRLTDNGNGTYTFPNVVLVENNVNNYTVVVEGVQYLERNVYLYFAGERGASQTMIGYDEGEFSVNVESTVEKTFNVDEPETPPTVSFKNGDASNISFMLLDPATGEVEFVKKYDIGSETSYEIPTEEGKISAVFIKQSTSGMFWFSQDINEDLQQAVIDCLKANNPSYKGHNAIAFGEGDHELEFKKGKFVTYTFAGDIADVEVKEDVKDEVIETTPVETTPVETTPVETTPAEPEKKPEAPKGELTVKVEGGKVKNWTVIDGVTGIYIEANGKIPAVIWTSVKVDDAALAAFVEALGADPEAEVIYDFGSHDITYNHNKNKTKTVTFTFTNLAQEEPAPAAEVAETEASEPVVEETKPEATETEPEVEETKASEPVVEETEPEATETEPEIEETKGNGKNKKNK